MRPRILTDRPIVEVRFGGTGGQGVIVMGVVLAVAATRDHRYVVQTQSYGPEARGGYSCADVILSDQPVDYPLLMGADLLVALSQDAADRYTGFLRPDGVLVFDSEQVVSKPETKAASFGLPFVGLAKEAAGTTRVANILTLATVVGIAGIVTDESLEKAVLSIVPPSARDVNLEALRYGFKLAESAVPNGSEAEESHAGSGH